MKLTESQLISIIRESTERILNEIGYHEKQKRDQSKEEHEAWVEKMTAAKKRYQQEKSKGEKPSDSKAIDYKDYKGGKGGFPVMTKESAIRLSSSDFNRFITESVKRVIKEMNETTLDYDIDNFSGRWSRGPRYDILVDGEVYYSDVPDESVDRLYADLERQGYKNIQVQEL